MNQLLRRAFRLSSAPITTIVGAGGKTTTLFQLGKEYRQDHSRVIVTTTNNMSHDQPLTAEGHLIHQGDLRKTLEQILHSQGLICLTGEWDEQTQRWRGLQIEELQHLSTRTQEHSIPLIIEADGARGRCLKAPAAHEPVIPPFCEAVIVVAGLAAIGKPLSEPWVHRPDRFAELSGCALGEILRQEAVQGILCHPLGGRKGIPPDAKSHVLLTQAESPQAQAAAKGMSAALLKHFDSVVVVAKEDESSLPMVSAVEDLPPETDHRVPYRLIAVHERIAAIILAAGASSRFGKPKPLLVWQGETLIHRTARLAIEADLQPIIVVCGAQGDQVAAAIQDLPVQIVQNENWQNGQSTSIKAGLSALGASGGGAIFLLVDQPFISATLLRALVEKHSQTLSAVIAPFAGDRRTNPVLFDRQTFGDLLSLEGDVGGRAIFTRYPPEWLFWHDERLPFDLDTPQDYSKLLEMDEYRD